MADPRSRAAFVITKPDGDADVFFTGSRTGGRRWSPDFAKARLFGRRSDAAQADPIYAGVRSPDRGAVIREATITLA